MSFPSFNLACATLSRSITNPSDVSPILFIPGQLYRGWIGDSIAEVARYDGSYHIRWYTPTDSTLYE